MTEEPLSGDFYSALLDDDAEALYEQAPCGYLSTTPDGTIVKVNGTLLNWIGYQRDELVGRLRFADLLTVGGRIYHETHYAPMLQMQGTAREIAVDVVCADGRRLPVLVNSVLDRNADGNPVVIRTAVFDATERRAYEHELLRAKSRAEESERRACDLARTLQQTLIPPTPPEIPGLAVTAAYRPAGTGEEVGGDFYDVFQLAAGDWVVAIGDVCGKGVEAALVTSVARHTIRAAAVLEARLDGVMHTLNEVLRRDTSDRFCTVVLLRLRRQEHRWTVTVCCGGHPLPLLARAGGGIEPIGRAGDLVGVYADARYTAVEVALRAGETVVLYTDGVTEARADDQFYGEVRLRQAIGGHAATGSAPPLASVIVDGAVSFQGGSPRDDIAVVTITVG